MKKFEREGKAKLVERGKTIAIILLSVTCLVSGCYVFNLYRDGEGFESLWGGSYVAAPYSENGSAVNDQNVQDVLLKLLRPESIMVNSTNGRDKISPESEDFEKASELVSSILKEVYVQPELNAEEVGRDEWQNTMKANSLYIKFAGQKTAEIERQFYEAPDNKLAEKIKSYRELVILPDSTQGWLSIYFADRDHEEIIKAILRSNMAEALTRFITEQTDINGRKYAFAYELNLDSAVKSDGQGNAKVVLDSFFLIPTSEESAVNVIVNVPKVYKNGLSFTKPTNFTTGLISIFGYNPNTIRQYTNSDDALIFVAKTGSLSVRPDGYIEYRALGKTEGVSLVAQETPTFYNTISGLVKMLDRIYAVSGVLPEYNDYSLRITNIQDNRDNRTVRIDIDYYADNRKIEFGEKPAISAQVNNGVLTELDMFVKTVKTDENKTKLPSVFEAIDDYYANNPGTKSIQTGAQVYKFSENGNEISAEWKIQGVM